MSMPRVLLVLFYSGIVVILFLGCGKSRRESDFVIHTTSESKVKRIQVLSNPAIHLSHAVELFVWPGEYPTRPMAVAAQKHFEPYKDHPAIKFSDSLLLNEVFYFDELTEVLLYLEDFPSTEFKHPLENSPYKGQEKVFEKWISLLADLYKDSNFDSFLVENGDFYEGAIQEVRNNLPSDNFIELIESFYREEKLSFTIIPAPEMPTGGEYGQRGIGPYVYTSDGMQIYQVISASLPVEKDSITNTYTYFGFDNKDFILRNSYHEFGHAFVNPILLKEENQELFNQHRHLFTPELQAVMTKQNYGNWFDCMAEHLVRLGEIRLAERSGNTTWARELREYHTDSLDFVFLPEFEKLIKQYEADESYRSFESFLPELIGSLNQITPSQVNLRLEK